jgi:hypothetical protein
MLLRCPYCTGETDERALVCPTCNRDVAIPASLRAEHEELLKKRDRLRADLAEARARLELLKRKVALRDASAD